MTCRVTSGPGSESIPDRGRDTTGRGIGGKPPTKRRSAKLVSVSGGRPSRTKKPRHGDGAKFTLARACRSFGNDKPTGPTPSRAAG